MVGCLIVVLAIGGSIFGTVLLSADESTYEVTKYDFKAEVTGLFDTDTSPEFFDYDLARNYTGYYTRESIINGVRYWDGATFTPTGVNNYPVRYEPANSETVTKTIDSSNVDSMTNTSIPGPTSSTTQFDYYNKAYEIPVRPTMGTTSYSKTLSSVISALGLGGYDVIEIICPVPQTSPFANEKLLFFGTVDQFNHPVSNSQTIREAYYVEKGFYPTYPQEEGYDVACHSCRIDTTTNMVSFYYNDIISSSTFVRTVSLNDAILSFSTTGVASVDTGEGIVHNSISFTVKQYDINVIDYMDISRGVTVTGVSA